MLGKRKKEKAIKFLALPMIILLFVLFSFSVIEHNLKPTIMSIAESRANLIATGAINNAIYDKVLTNVDYRDLIIIHKDENQRISMMQANSIQISKLIAETNLEIKNELDGLEGEIFKIPIGQTTGSKLLASYGPKVNVKILPVGEVKVNLIQNFQEAGINQTRHLLYLNVETTVKIVVPLVSKPVTIKTDVPIAETIIIGPVPNSLLRMNLGESLKNLTGFGL